MNIYKFRGKLPEGHRTVSGESWVYGDLVHINGEPRICVHGEFCLKVIPETVGLWLMNRSSEDIYQGDILEYIDPDGKKRIGVIGFGEYDNNGSGLRIGFYVKWANTFVDSWIRHDIFREVRIIGNIHDNPDLMEVSHV
ncbi:MAG: hypothetical protein J6B95_08300 [Oscillospiraceae bacterium]|nr:hypothetical protein [Oscillospiraceae bacterium]